MKKDEIKILKNETNELMKQKQCKIKRKNYNLFLCKSISLVVLILPQQE